MTPHAPTTPNPPRGEAAAPPQHIGKPAAELTPWQIKTRDRRLNKLAQVTLLVQSGMSMTAAVSEARLSYTTFWTWRKLYASGGPDGLIPKISKGRAPLIDPNLFTDEIVAEMQKLAVRLGGALPAARAFASDQRCPESLRDYVSARNYIPDALRRRLDFKRANRPVYIAGPFVRVAGFAPIQEAA